MGDKQEIPKDIPEEPTITLGTVMFMVLHDIINKLAHPWNKRLKVKMSQAHKSLTVCANNGIRTIEICEVKTDPAYNTKAVIELFKVKNKPMAPKALIGTQAYDVQEDSDVKNIINDISKHIRSSIKKMKKKRMFKNAR
jgi:hypothetical protein